MDSKRFTKLSLLLFAIFLLIAFKNNASAPEYLSQITDKALKECISKQIKPDQSADDITKIRCHSKGIKKLSGLEVFKNLQSLSLFNNRIEEADFTSFEKLEFINIAKNRLNSLQVNQLKKLQTLFAFKNRLETVNLQGLSSLTKLRMMENKLRTLNISELTALESAYLYNNNLEHLTIEGLNALSFLDVKQNPMPDELYDFFDEQEGIVIVHDGNADDWK